MLIYFNASVSSKAEYNAHYKKIVELLEKQGHKVIADHILDYPVTKRSEETSKSRKAYYSQMIKRIKKSDLMVAEISFPSTVHVGHELTLAMDFNKPVLALYQKTKRPILFWGLEEDRFLVEEYTDAEIEDVIKRGVDYLSEHMDTRFNFFISPRIENYLDWIAKNKRTPRAVYLRNLIKKDMEKNKDYSG